MVLHQKAINTFRVLSAEMVSASERGDTKKCFDFAPIMFTLFKDNYYNVTGEECFNRDRIVICDNEILPLYYSFLCGFNWGLSLKDLKSFPNENINFDFCKNAQATTDAPIGKNEHSFANSVGLAIAEKNLAKQFNAQKFNIISNYTYCFASFENLQEGVVWESAELAGKFQLGKLVCFVTVDKKQREDASWLSKKFSACGWRVKKIRHFNNYFVCSYLLSKMRISQKPTLILIYSDIENEKNKVHFSEKVLKPYEIEKIKADLGFSKSYNISNDVRSLCLKTERRLKADYIKWQKKVVLYKNTHPQLSEELNNYFDKEKINFTKIIKTKPDEKTTFFDVNCDLLNKIALSWHSLIGGSSEKNLMCKVKNKNTAFFSNKNARGKNIWFGCREEAMADICCGLSVYYDSPVHCASKLSQIYSMYSSIKIAEEMNAHTLFMFERDCDADVNSLQFEKTTLCFEPKDTTELVAFYSIFCSNQKPAILILNKGETNYELKNFVEIKKNLQLQKDDNAKIK